MFASRLLPLALLCASAAASASGLDRSLSVPLDHGRPAAGSARLDYEFGARFDPRKPTVIMVADGQQFYVRKGAMPAFQQSLFGPGVNVVGLVTRGTTPAFVAATLGPGGKPDWQRAWRIFNADQWIADIDALRRALVGNGKVMLYGRSGGAYLVHQYLAVHGDHVSRAFTQSPVNPEIVRDLDIGLDRFWKTLGAESPELQPMLVDLLKRRPGERTRILITLQRQHFFVPADRLKDERAKLIRALAAGDEGAYAQARKDYQVDDVMALLASNDSIPQNVRVLELIGPSGAFDAPEAGVSPLIEPQRNFAAPLIELEKAGRIPPPHFDLEALHRVRTEVFVLAAREDEAVDYRTTIALAYSYPHHRLFVADDNHTFARISGGGEDGKLIRAFFAGGLDSPRLAAALKAAAPYRWNE
ncbi:MAG TPA: alpha/beta fold hydrolase [Allosphingosinicella sp.]|jgi:pimeloyl-ACP methyl ester carboxylesterase